MQNLLNAYLFGPTSPLYQNLVLGKQLVDSMEPTYNDHRDPNLFGVLLRVKDAKNLKAVEHAILIEIKVARGRQAGPQALRGGAQQPPLLQHHGPRHRRRRRRERGGQRRATGDVNYLNKEFDAVAQLQPKDCRPSPRATSWT